MPSPSLAQTVKALNIVQLKAAEQFLLMPVGEFARIVRDGSLSKADIIAAKLVYDLVNGCDVESLFSLADRIISYNESILDGAT